MAIVAIFREPVLQGFQLLAQAAHLLSVLLDHGVLFREQRLLLLDDFVSLRQFFSQHLILFSQICKFFLDRHALTLPGLAPFGKSPAHLGSYEYDTIKIRNRCFYEKGSNSYSIICKVSSKKFTSRIAKRGPFILKNLAFACSLTHDHEIFWVSSSACSQ